MATIKGVAKLAGVSICTVSHAPKQRKYHTEDHGEGIVRGQGAGLSANYSARSLKIGSTDTLGLPDITNPYYQKVAKSIEEYAEKRDI